MLLVLLLLVLLHLLRMMWLFLLLSAQLCVYDYAAAFAPGPAIQYHR